MKGGYYHAVTGYSFPEALKVANWIAFDFKDKLANQTDSSKVFYMSSTPKRNHWEREIFLRLLNRMLFRACEPTERYKVLQRFYGLPRGLIERFYAGQLTWRDKARILIGKPPVPVHKALYNFSEKAFIGHYRPRLPERTL